MASLLIIIYILVYLIEKSFISSKINSNRVPSQIVFFFHIRLPLLLLSLFICVYCGNIFEEGYYYYYYYYYLEVTRQ